jgi:CubicO group peptidase (beta-lactamase class C family)
MRRSTTLLAALLVPAALAREPEPVALPKTLDPAGIDSYLAAQVRDKGFVGLSIALVRDGRVILDKSYGTAMLPDGPALTTDTPLAIGSVTKQFACAGLLLLEEDGKLSARDPVARYFPDLTGAGAVTLYDLMTHASGYPDYYPLDFLDRRMRQAIAPDELIRRYAGGKLDFPPGSRWSYSNTGYIIMGRVVEKVTGQPFGRFLEQRIFKPLGMARSVYEPMPDGAGLARGHTSFALGGAEPAPPEASGWLGAAGGIYATAGDLAKWDLALIEGKVLKPASLKLMTKPRELSSGKVAEYGCGLSVGRRNGETVWSHSGAVSGFHAYNAMIPRTRSAVILLSNAEHVDDAGLHRELLALLLRDEAKREEVVPVVAGPPVKDVVRTFFQQMQSGEVDRSQLGEEFSLFLSAERLQAAAPRLKELGEPESVEVDNVTERGAMESSRSRLKFKTGTVGVNMFRSTDGKIQQFLLSRN